MNVFSSRKWVVEPRYKSQIRRTAKQITFEHFTNEKSFSCALFLLFLYLLSLSSLFQVFFIRVTFFTSNNYFKLKTVEKYKTFYRWRQFEDRWTIILCQNKSVNTNHEFLSKPSFLYHSLCSLHLIYQAGSKKKYFSKNVCQFWKIAHNQFKNILETKKQEIHGQTKSF